jgi:dienelactone hydrolase
MRRLLLGLALLLPHSLMSQAAPAASVSAQPLETGKILPHIACAANPEQSYALYIPSNYASDRRWPIVFSSDPMGRGTVPLELERAAAERYGYILATSNNSRNGAWKLLFEATSAMLADVQRRLSVETRRVYFAGFSGGARASSQLALLCKCSAGVLLSGAGFTGGMSPPADAGFPVFSVVGTLDFNYNEVIPLQDALAKAGYPHWLRTFEGVHEWPPSEVMAEALAWFRVQAMKGQLEPLDQNFIDAQFSKAQTRAGAFEQSGDLLSAWREYLQIAATFESLTDVRSLRTKAEALGKDDAVREAVKRERNQFDEQSQLTASITSHMAASLKRADNRPELDRDLQEQLLHLRLMAEQEKRPEKAAVYKRALWGIFVAAMEAGNESLDEKKFSTASLIYDFATQTKPDSEWAWEELAVARARAGMSKEAIATLRRALGLTADKAAFEKWMQTEPAFDSLRPLPGFQDLALRN